HRPPAIPIPPLPPPAIPTEGSKKGIGGAPRVPAEPVAEIMRTAGDEVARRRVTSFGLVSSHPRIDNCRSHPYKRVRPPLQEDRPGCDSRSSRLPNPSPQASPNDALFRQARPE